MCAKFKFQLADRKENRGAGIAGTLFNFLSCISFLETASTDSLDTQIVMAENAMSLYSGVFTLTTVINWYILRLELVY